MYFERETGLSLLKDFVDTTWQSHLNPGDSAFVLPDGTSDIIIKTNSSVATIFLCGVMTRPARFQYAQSQQYFGIRFKPGFSSLFFSLGDTRDQLLQVNDLFVHKNQIEDLMEEPIKNHSQIEKLIFNQLLSGLCEADLKKKTKIISEYAKVQYGDINIFANRLNISRRQFSSDFKKHFGYDPRYFSKIKKFKTFLKSITNNRDASLCEHAIHCGFYDQADLSHTVKEVSGLTPKGLISQVYNTNS